VPIHTGDSSVEGVQSYFLKKHFLFHHQATVVTVSCSLRMTGM
jgi:hypothetical protein